MSDTITDLREALTKARDADAEMYGAGTKRTEDAAEAAWATVSAAIEAVEIELLGWRDGIRTNIPLALENSRRALRDHKP